MSDRIGRPCEAGHLGAVDPLCRLVGLHMYDGALKVLPLVGGTFKEAFNVRLEELVVLDLRFLHVPSDKPPLLAVLHQDIRHKRHLKTYEVLLRDSDKDLAEGPFRRDSLDPGASLLVPVPAPLGGLLVLGEQSIVYLDGKGGEQAVACCASFTKAVACVDADGSRHLLGDGAGLLYLLTLEQARGAVTGLHLSAPLGEVSAPSALAYLDNSHLFVGAACGDSQLVRLTPAPGPAGGHVEVLEAFPGLGPIVDFAVMDLERQGQGQVVTCSGLLKDGSLRVVRNGVGINVQAAVDLPGLKGLWSLRATLADTHDTFLVATFLAETRVLAINMEDELDETEVLGFDAAAQTLLCANATADQLLQVTPAGVRLVNAASRELVAQWCPPTGAAVNVAAANETQVLLGLGGGMLVYLEVGPNTLREGASRRLPHEISCLDCSPLSGSASAVLALAGTWNHSVEVLELPSLATRLTEMLSSDAIPRSVLLAVFEGVPHLLAGLGDGQLFTFALDAAAVTLSDRKKLSLGTQPISLRPFRSKAATHVFAASDRPTVVYSANHKLLFSNVNLQKEVNHVCPFNSAAFPDSLALANEDELTVGTIDDIQRLHIRTVPLGEQPRRIAHQEATRTFAVCCFKLDGGMDGAASETGATCVVRLLDDQTFDTQAVFPLAPMETACSVLSTTLGEDPRPYYLVGTSLDQPDELEPTRGRLLVLAVEEGALVLVVAKETNGMVSALAALGGKLLAGVNHRVMLYRWTGVGEESRGLVSVCSHSGHINVLYLAVRGDFILVGDIMKSMSLLIYKPEEEVLEERARDPSSSWMTAVAMLDDDTFLGAEEGHNLFVVRKNGDAATDEERQRLDVVAELHTGEQVNCIRPGSLVMRLPDSELAAMPTTLFVTANGAIGVIAQLPVEQYSLLQKVQEALCATLRGVGGFSWAAWRSFSNQYRGSPEPQGFIDGDLIESFLDLDNGRQAEVAQRAGVSVDQLTRLVEELARLH